MVNGEWDGKMVEIMGGNQQWEEAGRIDHTLLGRRTLGRTTGDQDGEVGRTGGDQHWENRKSARSHNMRALSQQY